MLATKAIYHTTHQSQYIVNIDKDILKLVFLKNSFYQFLNGPVHEIGLVTDVSKRCPKYSSGRKGPYDYEAFFLVNKSLRACISHDPGWNFTLWGSF